MSGQVCPLPGCRKEAAFARPLCRRHWPLVPAALQRELWDLWRRDPISRAYREARGRAIAAVELRRAALAPRKEALHA